MQPTPKQQLVGLLQLTERERWRQQTKRDRRLVEPQANRLERRVQQRALTRRQRRNVREREPRALVVAGNGAPLRHHADVRDRKIGLSRMTPPITKCANLLEPRRLDLRRFGRNAPRRIDH